MAKPKRPHNQTSSRRVGPLAPSGSGFRLGLPGRVWAAGIVLLGVLVLSTVAYRYYRPAAPPAWTRVTTGPAAGYIGSSSCRECHRGIVESYSKIAMGRSIFKPSVDNIVEDYSSTGSQFYHEPSRQYFQMTHENGKFYQTRFQKGPDGSKINELKTEVHYVFGSGNHARSYVHMEPDGKAYALPVNWYPQESKWAMNPGFDKPLHEGFSRRITYNCAFCHAAYPEIEPGSDHLNTEETSFFPKGFEPIDCERCHGPAKQHVEVARSSPDKQQVRDSIVNPSRLSADLQMDVCMQCHLESTSSKLPHELRREGRQVFSYRPGEPLTDYKIEFDHAAGAGHDDKFEIAGQAYRLRMSKCFTESEGQMTCITCHDPHHAPKEKVQTQIRNCMGCHIDPLATNPAFRQASPHTKPGTSCSESDEKRMAADNNCISCHMPSRRTDDVVHVVMTDHFIQRHKPARDLLAPRKEPDPNYKGDIVLYYPPELPPDESDYYLGTAYITDEADTQKGISLLSSYLSRPSAKKPESSLMKFMAHYNRGTGHKAIGNADLALADFSTASSLQPDNPLLYGALGDLYERQGDFDKALKHYKKLSRAQPRISSAADSVGSLLFQKGELDDAIKAYKRAASLNPFDENPLGNLGSVLLTQNKPELAEPYLRKAVSINPANPTVCVLMASCLSALDRRREAVWYATECLLIDPEHPHGMSTLRDILEQATGAEKASLLKDIESRLPHPLAAAAARPGI